MKITPHYNPLPLNPLSGTSKRQEEGNTVKENISNVGVSGWFVSSGRGTLAGIGSGLERSLAHESGRTPLSGTGTPVARAATKTGTGALFAGAGRAGSVPVALP